MATTTSKPSSTTKPASTSGQVAQAGNAVEAENGVAVFNKSRLPYAPALEAKFGIDRAGWTVLTEAIWPSAKTVNSVVMAISYCKARGLDPFKRVVHIVPMYNSDLKKMVDTVWPGIAELRTTAHRTGQYAGCDATEFGPDVETTFTGSDNSRLTLAHPEWARLTVYKVMAGVRVAFVGPKTKWLESYATVRHDSDVPNSMWKDRPEGQLEKVAEAAALRRAFPEQIGNDYSAEEMEGRTMSSPSTFTEATAPKGEKHAQVEQHEARPALAGPPKAPTPPPKQTGNGGGQQPAGVDQRAAEGNAATERGLGQDASIEDAQVVPDDAGDERSADSAGDGAPAETARDAAGPARSVVPPGVGADGRVGDLAAFSTWAAGALRLADDPSQVWEIWETQVDPWRERMTAAQWNAVKPLQKLALDDLMSIPKELQR